MAKKMITKLNEYKKFQQDEMLVELAKINKGELPFDVCVFGASSYSGGRNEHEEPHFHFTDKVKGGRYKLSILIPDENIWNESKFVPIHQQISSVTSFVCILRSELGKILLL